MSYTTLANTVTLNTQFYNDKPAVMKQEPVLPFMIPSKREGYQTLAQSYDTASLTATKPVMMHRELAFPPAGPVSPTVEGWAGPNPHELNYNGPQQSGPLWGPKH